MSFSFRNLFSKSDEIPSSGDAQPQAEAQNQQPFMNPQQTTGDGNFQAMFDQSVQGGGENSVMPMVGGTGADPRAVNPAMQTQVPTAGVQHHYLASELLAFIPPALAAQTGVPMEQTVVLELPADGSTDVRLSMIYAACQPIFAVEITPLNDSVVTLPPRLADRGQQMPVANPAPAAGMDFTAMREQSTGAPFANNPFADAVQSPVHPQSAPAPAAIESPPASANPFAVPESPVTPAAAQGTPSQFGFPAPAESVPEGVQAGISPFGAPPQPAPAEPSGATPTVGFSAIGPISDPAEGAPAPAGGADVVFPAGNPFDEAPVAQPPTNNDAAAANPFGASAFGSPVVASAAEVPAANPFESKDSFATIFSEKAQEDAQVATPGVFGAPAAEPMQGQAPAPAEAQLPTLEDALPPQAMDGMNPFAQPTQEPAPAPEPVVEVPNPFGQPAPAPAPSMEEALPPQPVENFQNPADQSVSASPAFAAPQEEVSPQPEAVPEPQPQPSSGFEQPVFNAGASMQQSPFATIEPPVEEEPAPAAQPESILAPIQPAADFDTGASDNLDDLSPFTAEAASAPSQNSFFDEITPDEPSASEVVAEPAPEAASVLAELPPAPQDSVVKNVELRAVFGTDEELTLDSVAAKTVGISGIATCSIKAGESTAQSARVGEGTMGLSQINDLANSAAQIAALTGVSDAGAFTMHTDKGLISIFSHESATVFVRHLAGEFDPGVREKLMLITRGVAGL